MLQDTRKPFQSFRLRLLKRFYVNQCTPRVMGLSKFSITSIQMHWNKFSFVLLPHNRSTIKPIVHLDLMNKIYCKKKKTKAFSKALAFAIRRKKKHWFYFLRLGNLPREEKNCKAFQVMNEKLSFMTPYPTETFCHRIFLYRAWFFRGFPSSKGYVFFLVCFNWTISRISINNWS